ncbi:hypothetical protein CEXT_771081 [Caerostris extrusa]|uniref:Transmembrane protein n=1 Tax=Caerostris extrusa TaxID=172846 RepID=A0AAV4PRK8_CAEEX|nr:hypothetical protein CEXT_771081 [Caerostris extrusa]
MFGQSQGGNPCDWPNITQKHLRREGGSFFSTIFASIDPLLLVFGALKKSTSFRAQHRRVFSFPYSAVHFRRQLFTRYVIVSTSSPHFYLSELHALAPLCPLIFLFRSSHLTLRLSLSLS